MPTARLTTNIHKPLFDFLTRFAASHNTTKREVLEDAVRLYQKEHQIAKMKKGYNALADDQAEMEEWLHIANNPYNL